MVAPIKKKKKKQNKPLLHFHTDFIVIHKEHKKVHHHSKETLVYLEQLHEVYRPRKLKFFKHYMNTLNHAPHEKGISSQTKRTDILAKFHTSTKAFL